MTTHDEIRAKRFILDDGNGGTLGEWKSSPGGQSLYMYDMPGDDKPVVAVALREDRNAFISLDLEGGREVLIETDRETGARVVLRKDYKMIAELPLPDPDPDSTPAR